MSWRDVTIAEALLWLRVRVVTVLLILGLIEYPDMNHPEGESHP
jgi:hypothetical protein